MQFFAGHVKNQGIGPTIEEFVFARKANFGSSGQPEMLNRFFAGALHPAIHTGYSAEFSLPGMLVEGISLSFESPCTFMNWTVGLAQVAVHRPVPGLLEPLLLFVDSLSDKMSEISLGSTPSKDAAPVETRVLPTATVDQTVSATSKKDDPHALTILARILRDPKFHPPPANRNDSGYDKTIKKHSSAIALYVNAWNIDPAILEDGGWEKKVEEIVWTVVVLYGIAGWTHGKSKPGGFLADFFLWVSSPSDLVHSKMAYLQDASHYVVHIPPIFMCFDFSRFPFASAEDLPCGFMHLGSRPWSADARRRRICRCHERQC